MSTPETGEVIELTSMAPAGETKGVELALSGMEQPEGPVSGRTENIDERPRIEIEGEGIVISKVAQELGHALSPHGIYLRGRDVMIYRKEAQVLEVVKPVKFRTWVEKFVVTVQVKDDGDTPHTMSSGGADAVLSSDQFREQLREVERFNGIRLPVMRENGTVVLLPEGYDRESKTLTAGSVDYPGDMSVEEAKRVLNDLLKDFPFADQERSKAICIAAMLSVYGIDLLPARTLLPVFFYRGNLPGLGKGLLAQMAIAPVQGYVPTGVKPKDETEMRKNLLAVAKDGRSVLFLDNLTGRVSSPSLESFITASTISGRVIGTSTSLDCKKRTVVFITGNNCTFNPDMARRTLVVELAWIGDPSQRMVHDYLDENRLIELRPQILGALYALVKSWEGAGKPKSTKINPNFVTWSHIIGGIVEHAGFGSVTEIQSVDVTEDPDETDMATLVEKIHEVHRSEGIKFQELIRIALANSLFARTLSSGDGSTRSQRTAMGRFLSNQNQRVFSSGRRFVVVGTGHAKVFAIESLPISDTKEAATSMR